MILQETQDQVNVLFNPEDIQERKKLEAFPGLLRAGLQFYCPNKPHVVYNLYCRLKKKVKIIKYTPYVREIVEGDLIIKQVPETFKFHTKPLPHQLIALRFAYTFGSFLNLSEPGLGKTKVTLDYIWLMQFKKTLIVCPKALRFVWEEERDKHRPELSVYVIETTDWEKEQAAVEAADVIVVNYDKAVSLEPFLEKLGFEFIAVDEGLIKNPSTERTKSITRLGKRIPYRSVMSGTLVNNSPLDVFAPLRFVEPALVGEAFGKFRDEYSLASKHNRFIVVGYKNVPEVKDMLASCSVIMTKAEWLKDLPGKVFHKKYVQMGDQQRDYYQQLAQNYLLQLDSGDEIEVDNPLSVLIKLNQISNGFVYYKDTEESLDELFGQEGKRRSKAGRKTYFFKEQPKAEALIKLIESKEFLSNRECGDDGGVAGTSGSRSRRAIIWFNLAAELELITNALGKSGKTFLVIAGGTKNIGDIVRQFNKDPSVQFLVCQAKTINYGVTIMGTAEEDLAEDIIPSFDPLVSDEIFYSVNFSLEVFLQQQDRIHRIGQVRECNYWLLLTNSKIERTIANRLEEKLICNKEILVDIIGTLGEEMIAE